MGPASQLASWHTVRQVSAPLHYRELHTSLRETLLPNPSADTSAVELQDTWHGRPLRILLAEDCPVNREVATGLLGLRGHQVRVAETGQDAVHAVQDDSFDIVLMDVEMPEMDGLEATRLIRAREEAMGRHTPIIAMTAHATGGFETACRIAGMDGYLAKPVDPARLYHLVESLAHQADDTHQASAETRYDTQSMA